MNKLRSEAGFEPGSAKEDEVAFGHSIEYRLYYHSCLPYSFEIFNVASKQANKNKVLLKFHLA